MIVKCSCVNSFQDKRYGPGMRVANFAAKASQNGGYRCTVCERIHFVSTVSKEDKKAKKK